VFGIGDWVKDVITGLMNAGVDLVTTVVMLSLKRLLDMLSATVFRSPDVTGLPQVSYVSGQAQIAANACMGLAVMVAGVLVMARGGAEDRYTVKAMLPRVLVGFAAANLATPMVSALIGAANALTAGLSAQVLAGDSFTELRRVVVDAATDPAIALVLLVGRIFVVILVAGLFLTWLSRIAVLLVLAGVAPVALACHAFVATEPVARLWWRSLVGTLTVQVVQSTALQLAVAVLLVPGANLPALGLPHDGSGLLNIMIAAFVLWMVWRVPTFLQRNFGVNQTRGQSLMGYVVRVVLVQQVMRAAGLAMRGGRRAVAGPRPPTTHQHYHVHVRPGRVMQAPRPRPRRQPPRPGPAAFSNAPTVHTPLPAPAGTNGPIRFSHAPRPDTPGAARRGTARPEFSDPAVPARPRRAPAARPEPVRFSHAPAPAAPRRRPPAVPAALVFSDAPRPQAAARRPPAPSTPVFRPPAPPRSTPPARLVSATRSSYPPPGTSRVPPVRRKE
jgi:hypothetical protein